MASLRREFEIVNAKGLHARAATALTKVASKFDSSVKVLRNGTPANGKSVMGLLILAAPLGSTIEVVVDGADASQAMQALAELIQSGFGE